MIASTHRLPELRLIGVASSLGAPDCGAEQGPALLQILGVVDAPRRAGLAARWEATLVPAADQRWPALKDLCDRLADTAAAVIAAGGLPVILGGDHDMEAGRWR